MKRALKGVRDRAAWYESFTRKYQEAERGGAKRLSKILGVFPEKLADRREDEFFAKLGA